MLYAFLGSLLSGGLAVLYVLWRKGAVETTLTSTSARLAEALELNQRIAATNNSNQVAYAKELAALASEIYSLRRQRDELIKQLALSGSPGSIADLLRPHKT